MIDQALCLKFFELLFGKSWAPEKASILTIRGKGDSAILRTFWATGAEEAAGICAREAVHSNVYAGTCLRKATVTSGRGKAVDVEIVPGLTADVDIASTWRESDKPLPPTEEDADSIVDGAGVVPSFVVHTGYGLQPYYVFRERFRITDEDGRDRIGLLSKAFGRRVTLTARKLGWDADSVHSLDHVFRVPGTLNWKDENDPKPVRIVFQSAVLHSVSALEETLAAELDIVAGEAETDEDGRPIVSKYADTLGGLRVGRDAPFPNQKFAALVANDAGFARLWRREKKRGDESQSAYDLALANLMALGGFSAQDIAGVIIAHRVQSGKQLHKCKRLKYYQDTIGKAFAFAEKKRERERAKEEAEIGQEIACEQARAEGPEAALEMLRKKLKAPISRFVRRDGDPGRYYLGIEGHEDVLLGDSKRVLSVAAVRSAIWDATRILIQPHKAKEWDEVVRLFSAIQTTVAIEENQRRRETLDWIGNYIERSVRPPERWSESPEGQEEFRTAFVRKAPFRNNGHVMVNTEQLRSFLDGGNTKVSVQELRLRLSEAGFKPEDIQVKVEGANLKRTYWIGVASGSVSNGEHETQGNQDGSASSVGSACFSKRNGNGTH